MSEPKFENRLFETLNFDEFPTLRETFSLKNEPKFQNFCQNLMILYPLERLNSFFVNSIPLERLLSCEKANPGGGGHSR